ncbi:CPBP family intramembrane glutamic endopeptidase [Iodobacter sp. CM08]|uniref:CPBP family intramembrane glutamic endopeptidase n=1 Tax=Iodobacter sp. CM08 TaxID=3085902 RepID=UPI00298270D9|nr:CPBP family intramembrane glutamic endopeptidase [Iodobacter sp. CM08]MDW5415040.1 CPBP family intramembrane glutamic endopeptidase [Iodobacter sp. CM08]
MLKLLSSPAYVFLILAIVCAWLPAVHWGRFSIRPWLVCFALALCGALATGVLGLVGLLLVLVLALALLGAGCDWLPKVFRLALGVVAALLALALAMHKLPGFSNLLLFKDVQLSGDALPFTLYANFDKGIAGLLLLAVFCHKAQNLVELKIDFRRSWWLVFITILLLSIVGLLSQFFRFDFKFPTATAVFVVVNLLLTCVAEEAFFRGFVQESLHRLSSKPLGSVLAVGASALLFGLAHLAGGAMYMALASLAGLGYAMVYQQSRRIEMAILLHFGFNLIHFLCFTYPKYVGA